MAWIELHQPMPRHPKTLKVARLMNLKRREACGLLLDLWTWALDVADTNGRLGGIVAEDIADALDYPRKSGKRLVSALVESGLIDVDGDVYVLHNWHTYAGKLNDKRDADRKRKERDKAQKSANIMKESGGNSAGIPPESERNSAGDPCATVPNRTYKEKEEDNSACAREGNGDAPVHGSVQYCQQNLIGMTPGNMVALREFLDDGLPDDVICLAVDEACGHGGGTWAYAQTILNRWLTTGVRSVAAAKQQLAQHKGRSRDAPPGTTRQRERRYVEVDEHDDTRSISD